MSAVIRIVELGIGQGDAQDGVQLDDAGRRQLAAKTGQEPLYIPRRQPIELDPTQTRHEVLTHGLGCTAIRTAKLADGHGPGSTVGDTASRPAAVTDAGRQ